MLTSQPASVRVSSTGIDTGMTSEEFNLIQAKALLDSGLNQQEAADEMKLPIKYFRDYFLAREGETATQYQIGIPSPAQSKKARQIPGNYCLPPERRLPQGRMKSKNYGDYAAAH